MFYGKILCILGPTCVGKTNLALNLSLLLPIEIISVDSSMIYTHMSIGTDKPHIFYLMKIKHHLINILDPKEKYSVTDFCLTSLKLLETCWKNNNLPVFVGGNLMYMWIFQNLFLKINAKYLPTNNINFINIGIIPNNKISYKKDITTRLQKMLYNGLIEEVFLLHNRVDINLKLNSIHSIGYQELWLYLDNKINFKEAKQLIITSTLNLANKQLLWLKKWQSTIFLFDSKKKYIYLNIQTLVHNYFLKK
ncbi:MAG TPA: isopentenyl transferase family protein [Candidatus Azoamicus sp. OHIO2]